MNSDLKTLFNELLHKIKADKKLLIIVLIGISGMLMIFISETTYEKENANNYSYSESRTEFSVCEEKLEKLIGEIDGAGRVKVMITYHSSSENLYAYDLSEKENGDSSSKEKQHIIVDTGNEEGGLLLKEIYPEVLGVAVVCDGGNNPTVKSEITALLKALFSISSTCISITKMSS